MHKLIAVLEQRVEQIYGLLHTGGNPSPAERFRLEGLIEAIEIMGVLSRHCLLYTSDAADE